MKPLNIIILTALVCVAGCEKPPTRYLQEVQYKTNVLYVHSQSDVSQDQLDRALKLAFRCGAVAMANAIRDNPDVQNHSGAIQVEAALTFWEVNHTNSPFNFR